MSTPLEELIEWASDEVSDGADWIAASRAELAHLRADLQAAQERIAEFESGALVEALLDANRTQADIIIAQMRQLDEARELLTTLEWSDWSDKVDAWLAANPAPKHNPVAIDELLPCPFCGTSDALRIFEDKSEDDPDWIIAYHVECGHCGCHGRNNYPIGWCESEQAAREAWNHRGSIRTMYENPAPEAEPQP